ncbi:hypothetical protein Ccrd_020797 [Cynara cardunculus var. scolymus]|uniref:Uncharacterized protein n=1 Tax=Cynara cardunculus var. scolymus TaxID=59895 RepID=A0A103Y1S1_CYNCS|nr:hypothetical protein Ccrd_020797 [Cynara cardunculus var. scolymus]
MSGPVYLRNKCHGGTVQWHVIDSRQLDDAISLLIKLNSLVRGESGGSSLAIQSLIDSLTFFSLRNLSTNFVNQIPFQITILLRRSPQLSAWVVLDQRVPTGTSPNHPITESELVHTEQESRNLDHVAVPTLALRRSSKIPKQPSYFDDFVCNHISSDASMPYLEI